MKKTLFILSLFLFLQLSAQETLSATEWQEDLRFLQNTIHKKYAFLFVKTTKETFDAEVETLYKEIPNLEQHEIIVEMTKIISSFKYGHTGIYFDYNPIKFHSYPFNLYAFSDGIFIQGVSKEYKKALGAKVLKINEIPIEEALKKIYPVVNAENSQFFKAFGINFLNIPEVLHAQKITNKLQKSVTLTLEKNGTTFTQTFNVLTKGETVPTKYSYVQEKDNWLDARNQSTTPLYLKHLDKIYFSEYLAKEKVLYVRHSQIGNAPEETTEEFYNRIFNFIDTNDVEKLVVDVRLNGGGNNYLNKSIITGILETKKINKIGRLYVIIGRRTFSACQNLVNELDNYTNAIFVGEPTAENVNFWGDARPETLPNSSIPVFLSYAWWQDKPAWENAEWLAPHIPATMSYEEYASNQDPILTAALTFKSGDDFKRDPMQYITDLFTTGKVQELTQALPKMIQDPRYSFCDFETELNTRGLLLLNSGRTQEVQASIQVFSMISQLFPTSAITYKNLGHAYVKLGNTQKATALLNKAISLDLDGEIGKAAKHILLEITN
ncbi:MAG: hypothetical protein AB8B65_06895 [Kordia sp.]|uniref:hypothetical protein n=1 Tax=Kordia sp. TaxID=1965332 RepID=UPI003858393E